MTATETGASTDYDETCPECMETLDECGCERCDDCGSTLEGECECVCDDCGDRLNECACL